MAHRTLINGTGYDISGGRELIGGTGYAKKKGLVLVNGTGYDIPFSSGIPLSTVALGDILMLNENGSPVPFYVCKHDYESGLNGAGRTLLVRKDCYDTRKWNNGENTYASSAIDSWLNGTYKNLLDVNIRGFIGTSKIKYTPGNYNNTVGTLERAIFLLSVAELGKSDLWFNAEGNALDIASTLQIGHMNGAAISQWTRTPDITAGDFAGYLDQYGNPQTTTCKTNLGSRPAFTLPGTFPVIQNPDGTYGPAA